MLRTRSHEKELLDLGTAFYTPDEFVECQRALFTINRLLGFFKKTVKLLQTFPNTTSLMDIGCGGGLFLLHLSQRFPKIHFVGMDIAEEAIAMAQTELQKWKMVHPFCQVTFYHAVEQELNLSKNNVDIILMTLVCHHLSDDEVIHFLKETAAAARKAVIIHDLHRHPIAQFAFSKLSPFISKNRLIRHDGLISIRRGFTKAELHHFLQKAHIKHYDIIWNVSFSWTIVIWKK